MVPMMQAVLSEAVQAMLSGAGGLFTGLYTMISMVRPCCERVSELDPRLDWVWAALVSWGLVRNSGVHAA
jgi:hypothetical protein